MTVQLLTAATEFTQNIVFSAGFTNLQDAQFEVGSGGGPNAADSLNSRLVAWNGINVPDPNFPLQVGNSEPEGAASLWMEIQPTRYTAGSTEGNADVFIEPKGLGSIRIRKETGTGVPLNTPTGARNLDLSMAKEVSSDIVEGEGNVIVGGRRGDIKPAYIGSAIIGGTVASLKGTTPTSGAVIIGGISSVVAATNKTCSGSVVVGGEATRIEDAQKSIAIGGAKLFKDNSVAIGPITNDFIARSVGVGRDSATGDRRSGVFYVFADTFTVGSLQTFSIGDAADTLKLDRDGIYEIVASIIGTRFFDAPNGTLISGITVNAALFTPTTTEFEGAGTLSGTDNIYVGWHLKFASGVNAGLVRKVTGYIGSSNRFTTEAFPSAPAEGDSFSAIDPARGHAIAKSNAFRFARMEGIMFPLNTQTWDRQSAGAQGFDTSLTVGDNDALQVSVEETSANAWLWGLTLEIRTF